VSAQSPAGTCRGASSADYKEHVGAAGPSASTFDGFMFSKACWSYRWRIHRLAVIAKKQQRFRISIASNAGGCLPVNVVHPCPYARLRSIKARFDPSSHLILLEPVLDLNTGLL
jgi:hypothetical protein